ncbi:small subunit ribosomal protein S21e [Strigomonas culicis]|uniref:Small subunit ribosomal protein S21e n=1 Tax=Strigomonas culicis TaxID=28005 RepID=S9TFF8_9TRYP|nr:small subunit ribosomal protein S21e [Strigomonas culicis]|eukprot:EPY16807.1 small subunit ribosomal protein S21e [Strigomonas culicis]
MATIGTYNEEGTNVDLMIPRKCHATNRLISSFDHSAVQIVIANVKPDGTIDGTTTTLCLTGYLRAQGESDHAINHLAIERGIVRIKSAKPKKAKRSGGKKKAAGADKKRVAGGANKKAPAGARKPGGAAPQRGAAPQKGARPAAQRGAKPQAKAAAPRKPKA